MGQCTPEGTARFKARSVEKGIPGKNFRRPYPLDESGKTLDMSTVGVGTYLGKPEDEDDFDQYNTIKLLVRSGTVNMLDTATNYRCQKAERTVGAAIRTLVS